MQKKGSKVRTWDESNMEKAINAVRANEMGIYLAAKTYAVPHSTLQRMARSNKSINNLLSVPLGRKPVFSKDMENDLVKYLQEMENRFWGLTRKDVRSLAFQIAIKNNIPNKFSILHQCAGKDWLYGFIRRHKENLSFRQPTGTSIDRAKGFNRENVEIFYNLLESIYGKKNFVPSRIWNVDETGLSVVQNKQPQIVAKKGKRQIGAMTSAERGTLVTVINCMSASGNFIPPFFIFPRKNQNPIFMNNAPADSKAAFHLSGWVQVPIFTQWFRHFLEFSKPMEEEPVLLILDGHYSHTRNIEVIDLARKHHVTILSLPPHSTHKMQPLDRTFMGPLKTYYNEEIRRFIREKGRKVVLGDVAQLFKNAFLKVQVGQIAINGFKCTGIYPFNRSIFQDSDFLAGSHDECANENEGVCCESPQSAVTASEGQENIQNSQAMTLLTSYEPIPSTSRTILTPWDISPPPKIRKVCSTRKGKKTVAKILTTSPYKNELEKSITKIQEKPKTNNKKQKETKKTGRRVSEKLKKYFKKKSNVNIRNLSSSSSSSQDSISNTQLFSSEDEEDLSFDIPPSKDTKCAFCNLSWEEDKSARKWMPCLQCDCVWAHQACTPKNSAIFICDSCAEIFTK